MWYQQLSYTFKTSDTDYINTLVSLYPEVVIAIGIPGQLPANRGPLPADSLNFKGKTISNLHNLIAEVHPNLSDTEISIITERTPASETTKYVFPQFHPQAEYLENSKNDREKYKDNIKDLIEFIRQSHLLLNRPPCSLSKITNQEDAWKIVNLLQEQLKLSCAMSLPSVQGILLLSPNYAFLMSYHNHTICDVNYPGFDLDDGFFPSPYGSIITQEMEDAFKQWKNNDRKGPVFSEPLHSFRLKDSELDTISSNNNQSNDQYTELDQIKQEVCKILADEMDHFLSRRKIESEHELNEKDKMRYAVLSNLVKKINEITTNIKHNPGSNWKVTYKNELTDEIKKHLLTNTLDKYTELQKIGIRLLNLISIIFCVIPPVKKLVTGTWFFSTQGKPKESVQVALERVNSITIN